MEEKNKGIENKIIVSHIKTEEDLFKFFQHCGLPNQP